MHSKVLLALTAFFTTAAIAQVADPYLWLEDIQGVKPLAQVRQWNADTETMLKAVPGFEARRRRALA